MLRRWGFAIVGNIAEIMPAAIQYEYASAYAAFPTLGWTDARKEFMLAEKRTAATGTCIIGPEENENTQGKRHVETNLAIEADVSKLNTLIIEKARRCTTEKAWCKPNR